jgi:hypothetical protein
MRELNLPELNNVSGGYIPGEGYTYDGSFTFYIQPKDIPNDPFKCILMVATLTVWCMFLRSVAIYSGLYVGPYFPEIIL